VELSENAAFFIVTAVKTSNPTELNDSFLNATEDGI
jgi:hypothetical protein